MLEYALEKMTKQYTDDRSLLKSISKRDKNALSVLYSRYGDRLLAFALRILSDRSEAEDVLQESLLIVWQKAGTFRGDGSVKSWLFSIVHNKAMMVFRKKKTVSIEDLVHEPESSESELGSELGNQDDRQMVLEGLKKLSTEHRTVLELVFYEGMSMKETARVCGIPVGTVKSRINHAKNALKGELVRHGLVEENLW